MDEESAVLSSSTAPGDAVTVEAVLKPPGAASATTVVATGVVAAGAKAGDGEEAGEPSQVSRTVAWLAGLMDHDVDHDVAQLTPPAPGSMSHANQKQSSLASLAGAPALAAGAPALAAVIPSCTSTKGTSPSTAPAEKLSSSAETNVSDAMQQQEPGERARLLSAQRAMRELAAEMGRQEVGAPQLRQMEQLVDALRRVLDLEARATQSELKQPAAPDGGPRAQVPLPAEPAIARASAPIQQASHPNLTLWNAARGRLWSAERLRQTESESNLSV